MAKIGIIGANGFFGSALCRNGKKQSHEIVQITRQNFDRYKKEFFDIIVNSATPSKKYWALHNPYDDFVQTVQLTADLAYNWNYNKLVQISTMSANDLETIHPYTINKKAAEVISSYKKFLIVRLSNLFGEGLNKGPLFDLLTSKKIFVDIKSEYSFIDTDFVANWIFENLHREGIVQVGARDTISLQKIAEKLNLEVKWSGKLERIFSKNLEPGMPSVEEVWKFIEKHR